MNFEKIIEKLQTVQTKTEKDSNIWRTWNKSELIELLKIYHIFCKKENHIFDLIYSNHGCDSWEDIFRDYDKQYLEDKARGVEIALTSLDESDE